MQYKTITQCTDYLYGLTNLEKNLRDDKAKACYTRYNMRHMVSLLKNRYPDLLTNKKVIHIAGTKGKGSTAYIASSLLMTHYKVATFVSPHLISPTERLLMNLNPISDEEFVRLTNEIAEMVDSQTMDSRVIATDSLFPNDERTRKLRDKIKQNQAKILRLKEQKMEKSEESIVLKAENKEHREELKEHTEFLVKSSRLVFSTISNFILSTNLYESKFDNLIVDEASMMAMPSLLALGHKISKRLILVGDFQQLSPISTIKVDLLRESVFEMSGVNIKNTDHPALTQLLNQRRSNEKIVDLINRTFYQGKLIPAAKKNEDIINSEPFRGKVIALKMVSDGAVRYTKGGTRQNKVFADNVMSILDCLCKDKDANFTIGIITPYRGQVSLLKALKYERKYKETFDKRIKIGTVHTFQGSECDIIIFDMVDCFVQENGKPNKIGKLYAGNDGERLINVAVSRARHKLIIVCDPEYIKNIPGNKLETNTRALFNKLSMYK